MTFKNKLYLLLSTSLILNLFLVSTLCSFEVNRFSITGRIISIEKQWLNNWKLTIYSNGELYQIDIPNADVAKDLEQKGEEYILFKVQESYIGDFYGAKYRLESWADVTSVIEQSQYNELIVGKIDKHLVCSLLSQLANNRKLSNDLSKFFGDRHLIEEEISKVCSK